MLFTDIEPLSVTQLYSELKDLLRGPHYAYLNTIRCRARIFNVRRRKGILEVRIEADAQRMKWEPVGYHNVTLNACSPSERTCAVKLR